MRRFVNVVLVVVMLTMLLAPLAFAGGKELKDGIGFKAEFRYRSEFDGKDFDKDTDMHHFCLMRARLGVIAKHEDVLGYAQLQSPFTIDADGSLGTDPADNIHQAFLKVNNLFIENLWLKAGRFEMNYADQRLIGGVGWSQTGRAFEGMKFGYWNETFWFDVFSTTLAERKGEILTGATEQSKDDRFMGLWAGYKPLKLQGFFLSQNHYDPTDVDWETNDSRHTLGLHYSNKYEMGLYTRVNFAYQMGTDETYVAGNDPTELDIAAYLFTAEVFYNLDVTFNPWIGLGIDLASGDDDGGDDKNAAFNNLYLTGHKYHGYMDMFVGTDPADIHYGAGLRDIYFGAKFTPMDKMKIKLMFHNFASAVDYNNGSEEVSALGNELDVVMTYKLKDTLAAEVGVGLFMPSEDFAGDDAENATWAYLQLMTKFDLFD